MRSTLKKIIDKPEYVLAVFSFIIFCFLLPFSIPADEQANYFVWLSGITGFTTLIVALLLYDKLDSKKVAFSKEVEAVENLTNSLVWLHLNFVKANIRQLNHADNSVRELLPTASFYLNWFNIMDKRKATTIQPLKVCFTVSSLEQIKQVAFLAQNPWVPKNITDSLKPLILFNYSEEFFPSSEDETFMIVKPFGEPLQRFSKLKIISYSEKEFKTFGDYINAWEQALKTIKDYYSKNFDTSPNFDGD